MVRKFERLPPSVSVASKRHSHRRHNRYQLHACLRLTADRPGRLFGHCHQGGRIRNQSRCRPDSQRPSRRHFSRGRPSRWSGLDRWDRPLSRRGSRSRLLQPSGRCCIDAAGNIYVADTGNNTIRKITAAGQVSTVAGSPGTTGSTDGTGGAALFNSLRGFATDAASNVYIADTFNDVIRKMTLSSPVSTLAGTAGLRDPAYGTRPAAQFIHPHGLTTDSTGNVHVADTLNHTTRMITPGRRGDHARQRVTLRGNDSGPAPGISQQSVRDRGAAWIQHDTGSDRIRRKFGSARHDVVTAAQRSRRRCSERFGRSCPRTAAAGDGGAGTVRAEFLASADTMTAKRIVIPM
jgi:hypothetical protein